jgi:hypothetical protein
LSLKTTSREIQLVSRPKGIPTKANFTLAQVELAPLQNQQVLVRNLLISVDPYMRGRMNEGKSYVPPFELGKALEGGAVGEVVESLAKELKPGDIVTSGFGWREYFIASPKELHPVSREAQPLSVYLGALGMTGMTAWAGLNLVEVKAGDVVFISGAAGAVGMIACSSCLPNFKTINHQHLPAWCHVTFSNQRTIFSAALRSECSNASINCSSSRSVIPMARPTLRQPATARSTSCRISFARRAEMRK